MSFIANNISRVRQRIEQTCDLCSRNPEEITLMAVSKTRTFDEIRQAWETNQLHFGENYLQEAQDKISQFGQLPLVWHYIGHIQSNKTRQIAQLFDWAHTVERASIANRLNQQRPEGKAALNVCIQVNIDHEQSKSGVSPDKLLELADAIASKENLRLRGIMAIPAPGGNDNQKRDSCERTADLYWSLKQHYPEVDTLSLGMSNDLEQAIAAGSTMVRIGTDIFGPRTPR